MVDILGVICNYPHMMIMGGASLLGAMVYATYSVLRKRVEEKKFKFDYTKILDTAWQSTVAGAVAGLAIGCSYVGIVTAMITGVGINKICDKIKMGDKQFLNLVELVVNSVTSRKK